jgi:hypothetical protein
MAISLKLANLVGLTCSIQRLESGTFTVPSGHLPVLASTMFIHNSTKIKQKRNVVIILLSVSILLI